jgi:enoyl-CoA hydratase
MTTTTCFTHPDVIAEASPNGVGLITLNRPGALNALSLPMIRALTSVLRVWKDDDRMQAVAVRGKSKHGDFGAFCAGGDIRFFHQAATEGHADLEDFFTEEYALNHLVFTYPKPYIAFMDGVVMGGGMGISQGGQCRIVTERTRMAMPETLIGLFPDVGGGFFLSRTPGHVGEYLGLTGQVISGAQAMLWGLADVHAPSDTLSRAWDALRHVHARHSLDFMKAWEAETAALGWQTGAEAAQNRGAQPLAPELEQAFAGETVMQILQALQAAGSATAVQTSNGLRQRSPLMLHVVLEQIRRARHMDLSDELRMERDLVRHCFHPAHLGRLPAASETVEGIRALAVDKDHTPRWVPDSVEAVLPHMVEPFFVSPWPAHLHPLRDLA